MKIYTKPFIGIKKTAENGDEDAMNNLAICYKNREGTEKNLEKTFNWYQKVATNKGFEDDELSIK